MGSPCEFIFYLCRLSGENESRSIVSDVRRSSRLFRMYRGDQMSVESAGEIFLSRIEVGRISLVLTSSISLHQLVMFSFERGGPHEHRLYLEPCFRNSGRREQCSFPPVRTPERIVASLRLHNFGTQA